VAVLEMTIQGFPSAFDLGPFYGAFSQEFHFGENGKNNLPSQFRGHCDRLRDEHFSADGESTPERGLRIPPTISEAN
jgi:hypothetical protein